MPIENANYISQLDPSLPLGTDPVASADDHIRLIKNALKGTFPNLNAPITVDSAALNSSAIPKGFIGLWSGAVASVPLGWFLCNGQNGTPDLRDRFVVGAGGSYAVAATGGAVNATTTTAGSHVHALSSDGAHTHTGTVDSHVLTVDEIPSHSHFTSWGESNAANARYGISTDHNHAGSGETDNDNYDFQTSSVGGSKGHSHGLTVDAGGAHTHTAQAGGDHSHAVDTRSPYFALAYIMKG